MTVRPRFVRWQVLALAGLMTITVVRARAENEASIARMKKDVTFLASDECEGRGVTTKGINIAADYIAAEFKAAGLKPAGVDGSYYQPFTMTTRVPKLASPPSVVFHGVVGQDAELEAGTHYQVLALSSSAKITAPLVFAGYGITCAGYDDYKGFDIAGKAVLVIRKAPRASDEKFRIDGNDSFYHSTFAAKLGNAEKHKAAAILLVNDRESTKENDHLLRFTEAGFQSESTIPCIHIRRAVANELLLSATGKTLKQVEEDIDRDMKPQSAPIAGSTAQLDINLERPGVNVKNVIGAIDGSGPLANEIVIIGAHYDHLGYGGMGSLARGLKNPTIHHGADDNGSGSTMVMELARRYAEKQKNGRQGRKLVFMTFSGEESGLLGSIHYCKQPIFPLTDTVTMVNLDMVGRLRPDKETQKEKLLVYGTKSSPDFDKLIDSVNEKYNFMLKKTPTGRGPSDMDSFYVKNIPVYFFFTDLHDDYHRPSDTADKINLAGMGKIADMVEDVVDRLQSLPERPKYSRVETGADPHKQTVRGEMRTIGVRPDYGDNSDGVLLGGVTAGRAAAKAGLKEGDRIVELAGKPIKNLEAYMAMLAGRKKGEEVEVGVLRDGKKMTFKVSVE